MPNRLQPATTRLHVVRWIREDGRDVKHKHFTREHDARAFYDRLIHHGKTAAIYSTHTDWKPTT